MFTGPEIVATLEALAVTHVIWLPDSTLGTWEEAIEGAGQLNLVRVCREGEAWPLAAGLQVGGQSPVVMMQTTGFYESGDAMRNVLKDLRVPVFAIIGVRNWLIPSSNDSAKVFAEPIVEAWGLQPVWIDCDEHKSRLADHYRRTRELAEPGIVLMAEGKG